MSKIQIKTRLINCEEAAKMMNDYIDNYLKNNSKEDMIAHLNTCRHCFDKAEFEKMLKQKISSLAINSAEEKIARKKAEKILSGLINN
jgi:predicted RNA-binding protein